MSAATPAHAVCSTPSGTAGQVIYNSTGKIFQYCNDNDWVRMSILPGSGSGGCLPSIIHPLSPEGTIIYNKDARTLQGCAGNQWLPMGQPATGPTQQSWTSVSAGNADLTCAIKATCAVKTNGSLWCWGSNSSGRLGLGRFATSGGLTGISIPQQETSLALDWTTVEAGWQHTCAMKTNGTLWCWGNNSSYGELGIPLGSNAPFQHAICTDPARSDGTVIYNSTENVLQYCDGLSWRRAGK